VVQALRENLSSQDETIVRLNDELSVANRRHTSAEDELANQRTIIHGLDNELLVKSMSLDQALRVCSQNFILSVQPYLHIVLPPVIRLFGNLVVQEKYQFFRSVTSKPSLRFLNSVWRIFRKVLSDFTIHADRPKSTVSM